MEVPQFEHLAPELPTLRLGFVITGLNVGGAEKALTSLAIGCAAAGDRVAVFSLQPLPPPGSGNDTMVRRLREAGIDITAGGAIGWRSLPAVTRQLRQWLSRHEPELVQSFLYHANVLTAWVSIGTGTRRVAGLRVAESRAFRLAVEQYAMIRFDHVVAVSDRVADFAHSPFGLRLPRRKISVIANGVVVPEMVASGSKIRQEFRTRQDIVVVVGRLHRQKGIDRLISKLASGWSPGGGTGTLVFVGDGPMRESLQRTADGVNATAPGTVVLTGWRTDAAAVIAQADLLLLASRYEGMANVLLEAMAAGIAVVCSDIEGVGELLPPPNRQVVPINDDEALIQRVDELLADRQARQRLGEQNRRRAATRFGVDRMVEKYRDLYRRLLDT